jgi:hypothetical protein
MWTGSSCPPTNRWLQTFTVMQVTSEIPKNYEPEETLSWQENVGYFFHIDVPVLSILFGTPLLITSLSVEDHRSEKCAVEVWKRRLESTRQTPAKGHDDITSVLKLAYMSVPTINQKVALYERNLDRAPNKVMQHQK